MVVDYCSNLEPGLRDSDLRELRQKFHLRRHGYKALEVFEAKQNSEQELLDLGFSQRIVDLVVAHKAGKNVLIEGFSV